MINVLTNGMDLKLSRVARMVSAKDLAARMGVSQSSISRIERLYAVDAVVAARYRTALSTFPAVTTAQEGPEAA